MTREERHTLRQIEGEAKETRFEPQEMGVDQAQRWYLMGMIIAAQYMSSDPEFQHYLSCIARKFGWRI